MKRSREARNAVDLQTAVAQLETPAVGGAFEVVSLGGLTVRYADGPSLRTQIKDIFEQRIYHFETRNSEPLIIDGGASIGMAALYWKQQYPDARVICFEPDANVLELLRDNIAANNLAGLEVVPAALSDRCGTAAFEPDGSDGGKIVGANTPGNGRHISIATTKLSKYIRADVDLLKLNVEGQELAVLRELEAASKLQFVSRIIVEYHGWAVGPQRLGEILELLDRNGFRYLVHDFDRQTNPATKPPFRIRDQVPWFCLIYAERGGANRKPAGAPRPDMPAPVSRVFGLDRGTPIDRYYIEAFLARHQADIRGRVMEVGDATYTQRFGGGHVTRSDVLHAGPNNRKATLVGDLATGAGIPTGMFDCIVLTQVLQCIYDLQAAVRTAHNALAPGGVLLATLPGISQISRYDMDRWGDFWRLTTRSAGRLFADVFGSGSVDVAAHGNVAAAKAFLDGAAVEEMAAATLDAVDPDYEMLITVRAVRSRA